MWVRVPLDVPMPYITQTERERFQPVLVPLVAELFRKKSSIGVLNYLITILCKGYIQSNGCSYETLNAVVGALECAKLEFSRRFVNPYEDEKIKENGDIY